MNSLRRFAPPKLKNPDDFESIVLESLRMKWPGSDLQKHGRSGQKQRGVDIYGSDDLERPVGIQCKNLGTPLDKTTILREIEKAEEFPNLNTYYMATADSRDAKLQLEVRALSKERVAAGKFALGIFFWDDIIEYLTLSPQIFGQFFPEYSIPSPLQKDLSGQYHAAFDLGVYDVILHIYVDLSMYQNNYTVSDGHLYVNEYINILLSLNSHLTKLSPKGFNERITKLIQDMLVILDKKILNKDELALLHHHGKHLLGYATYIPSWLDANVRRVFLASRILERCLAYPGVRNSSKTTALSSVEAMLPSLKNFLCEIRNAVPPNESSNAWVYQTKELIINKVIWGAALSNPDLI